MQRHEDVIKDGLGTLEVYKAKIHIIPGVSPRFCEARLLPYSTVPLVEEELDKLVVEDIIEPVQFADWAVPIVPVLKQDKVSVRIRGHFKLTINQVFKLDRYPIPRIEDLFAKLTGDEQFTHIDLSQAYQQLLLDYESKDYAVINTHQGLFRRNHLSFGISSAPGIFQRAMETLL